MKNELSARVVIKNFSDLNQKINNKGPNNCLAPCIWLGKILVNSQIHHQNLAPYGIQ